MQSATGPFSSATGAGPLTGLIGDNVEGLEAIAWIGGCGAGVGGLLVAASGLLP